MKVLLKVLLLPVKNITKNFGRSLSLGFFVCVSCIIYIVCGSVINTVKENSRDALIYGLTGDVQIRNNDVEQQDFVDMNTSWQNAEYLKADELKKAKEYVDSNVKEADAYERVRHVGALMMDDNYADALLIGITEGDDDYQKSFKITEGNYLRTGAKKQIVVSNEIADKLDAGVGDTIVVNSMDINDDGTMIELEIVGIGMFESLAGYGNNMCFVDINSVRTLKGLSEDEATELILRIIKAESAEQLAESIENDINAQNRYTITSWKTQGGYVKVINTMITVIFYVFMIILVIIICLSIGNMVGAIAIERVREIGTLRAIGFSRGLVDFLFVAEIFLISLVASFFGTVVASIICLVVTGQIIEVGNPMNIILGSSFNLRYSLVQSLPGIAAFIVLGCLAAYFPVRKMNRNQLVNLINNDF